MRTTPGPHTEALRAQRDVAGTVAVSGGTLATRGVSAVQPNLPRGSRAEAQSPQRKRRGTHTVAQRAQREEHGSHAEARGTPRGVAGTVAASGGAREMGGASAVQPNPPIQAGGGSAVQPNLPLPGPHLRSPWSLRCGASRPWFKNALRPISAVQPNPTRESRAEAQRSQRKKRGAHTEAQRKKVRSHAEARGALRGEPGTVAAIGATTRERVVSAVQPNLPLPRPNLPQSSSHLRSPSFLRCGASRPWFENGLQLNPLTLQPNLPLLWSYLRSSPFLRCGASRPWFKSELQLNPLTLQPNPPLPSPPLRSPSFLRCGASRPWFKSELQLNPLTFQPNPPTPRPLPRARDCSGDPAGQRPRSRNGKPGWRSQGPHLPLTEAQ
jgi:hypothetical protein